MLRSLITQTLPKWLYPLLKATMSDSKMSLIGQKISRFKGIASVSLEDFLQQNKDIPPDTALLGICEDALPILIDLKDQNLSPLVILGEEGCHKTSLIQVFLESALSCSSEETIQFLILTNQTAFYERLVEKHASHCLGLYEPNDSRAEKALQSLAERLGEAGLAPRDIAMVFLDDLSTIRTASSNFRNILEDILREGAAANIWLVATMSAVEALKSGRWLRFFRTRILGTMPLREAQRLGLHPGLDSHSLSSNYQYVVFAQRHWLKFWTLKLEN